jgi:inorganic triphosphatase YgiF
VNSVAFEIHRVMRVSAEDAVRAALARVGDRARSHLGRHAQPPRVQPVDQARERIAAQVQLLQQQVKPCAKMAERQAVDGKAIELVPVNGEMAKARVVPGVLLKHTHADEMRHDVGETEVVVALNPHHFDLALGIRQLADGAQELPVLFLEATEIEVSEDVAQ